MATRQRSQINVAPDEVGVRFNKWRKPVSYFGPGEDSLVSELRQKFGINSFDISSAEWRKATETVDSVLRMIFSEVAQIASKYCISIEKFVRQGSSREGLKVCSADEFDSLLLFSIDGLQFEVIEDTDRQGRISPETGRLRIVGPSSQLEFSYPKLHSNNVFHYASGNVYLCSRMLHERVFTGIVDSAKEKVRGLIDSSPGKYRFRMTRAVNPPSIQVRLTFDLDVQDYDFTPDIRAASDRYWDRSQTVGFLEAKRYYHIDLDIVPALLIQTDKVPDPTEFGREMDCPRYAVFKWVGENNAAAMSMGLCTDTIWRMDSSGYEKHVLDVAQGTTEQRYIITALRVLKAVFRCLKLRSSPPQTVTVLRSYFLKQLAFYCILYYTVLHRYPLSGVREALGLLLGLLQISLEERRLPHFFHTNLWLSYMFPNYRNPEGALRFDVYRSISSDALLQAKLDLNRLQPQLEEFTSTLPDLAYQIQDKFRDFIREGDYI